MSDEEVSPAVQELRCLLKERYLKFFHAMGVDPRTGDYPACRPADRKFAGYPFMGSRYGLDGDRKLLVVGLDIGADPGNVESFEERRRAIECKPVERHNPHIAGTYFTALKYAGPECEWKAFEEDLRPCQRILKEEVSNTENRLPSTNPLSRIALTNFYKWVTKQKKKLSGGDNRIHFNRDLEIELFRAEVRILEPDVVVFQSATFRSSFEEIIPPCRVARTYVVNHPSYRGKKHPAEIGKALAAFPPE